MDFERIIQKIEAKERKTKRRILYITLIPIISSVALLTFTSVRVIESRKELKSISHLYINTLEENRKLKAQNDSLQLLLKESTETLGKASSVLWNFKKFIDEINPPERTTEEAKFFIKFRMLEEKIRGDYEFLSENLSKLPSIKDNKDWIVIVESNISKEDLEKTKKELISIYGSDQVAIYKDAKNIYALAVKGNGSFTRAYRLNVELRNLHGYWGSYFRGVQDWGKDYTKK